jgi:glycosyltransferase involved in cell wall biosynthesis
MTTSTNSESIPLAATTGSLRLGGSSTFLLNLVAAFQKRNINLPVAILSNEVELQKEATALRADVSFIDNSHRIYEDCLAWGYQQLARHKPRAVLANLGPSSFEILRLVPPGVLRIGIIQSDDPEPYDLVKNYTPWLDVIVGVSEVICQRLREMPECARMRVEYIPYGIHFAPQVAREARSAGAPLRVVYLGRIIEEQKRISRLVSVIRLCQERNVDAQFTIIGSGPQEETMKAEIGSLPNVQIKSSLPNYEVFAALRQQDVFLLLSDYEGLPLSLLEAMGEGVVPIVSDLPSGIRGLVNDSCGIRVPVGDLEAAIAAITKLAQDVKLRECFSQAGILQARNQFSADLMAERYLRVIKATASKGGISYWPDTVEIPVPVAIPRPWLYHGLFRRLRRRLKVIF